MWPRFGYRWATYGIGRIPMPAPKVDTVSRQERRDAAVAELIRERAAAQRTAQQKPAAASQRKYLPLQGGGRPSELSASEAKAGGWGSFQRSAKTPTIADASHRRSWRKERRPPAADALPLSGEGARIPPTQSCLAM
jgi:hypothetical protein